MIPSEALRRRKEADRLAREITRKNAQDFADAAESAFSDYTETK